jgi:hypothetical protein
MEEIVLKIKELKKIRADNGWVVATKSRILSRERADGFLSNLSWLKSRTFVFIPSALIVCVGLFFLYNNLIGLRSAVVSERALKGMAENLMTVQSGFLKVAAGLEKVDSPEQMAKIQKTVGATIKSGEGVVSSIKTIVRDSNGRDKSDVLAALAGVEGTVENIKGAYLKKQKELAGGLIDGLEGKMLSEEQASLLVTAKKDYDQGNFGDALLEALQASQPAGAN